MVNTKTANASYCEHLRVGKSIHNALMNNHVLVIAITVSDANGQNMVTLLAHSSVITNITHASNHITTSAWSNNSNLFIEFEVM